MRKLLDSPLLIELEIDPSYWWGLFFDRVTTLNEAGLEWKKASATDERYPLFYHNLIRQDFNVEGNPGHIVSHLAPFCMSLIYDIAEQCNIKVDHFLKMSFTTTYHVPGELHGDIHTDHIGIENYFHFILYLNDITNGHTYLYDKNHRLIANIVPKKYKAIIFENTPHAQGHCGIYETRVALLATFIGKQQT